MYNKLKEIFNEYSFEIVILTCIVFILLYFLYTTKNSSSPSFRTKYPTKQKHKKVGRVPSFSFQCIESEREICRCRKSKRERDHGALLAKVL